MTKPKPGTWVKIKEDLAVDRSELDNEPVVLTKGLVGLVVEDDYDDHLVDVDFGHASILGSWVWTVEPCELEF